jgi:putative hydroxymethylpyrimidine transport system substrate-binding protein
MTRRTGPLVVALGVALALALAGCGQRQTKLQASKLAPLRVAVIPPNAGEASIYAARKTGAFKLAGLSVTLRPAADPAAAIKQVESGAADLAVGSTPDLLEARDRGARVVSVAALVQHPLASLIALRAGTPATVGTLGRDYQAAYARTALKHASVKIVNVAAGPARALTSRKVDALVGAYSNVEGVELKAQRKAPRVTPVDRLGVPRYDELVLVASAGSPAGDGDVLRSFVGALARATHELRLGKAGPVSGWTEAASAASGGKPQALAALKLTLPLTFPAAGRPFGFQQPSDWSAFGRWMHSEHLVKRTPTGAFSNRVLGGPGSQP